MNLTRKLWNFLFPNFMWLYIIAALANLTGYFVPVLQLLMIVCFVYGTMQLTRIKSMNILDSIILLYLIYVTINSVVIDYPHHLSFLVHAFIFQLCPLMCYFIARTNELELETIFRKMMLPMIIVMVLGLYFHLAQPEWYTAIKWAIIYDKYGTTHLTDNNIIEQMRLTSIFGSSYYIAFSTLFFSVYLLYALTFRTLKRNEKFFYVALIFICVAVMIFANHRTTLLGFMIAYIYCFIRGRNKDMRGYMILGAVVIAALFIAIMFSSEEYMNYIKMRFEGVTTEEGYLERLDHTGGEQNLLSLFGDGYGRHSLRAREYGGWALIDSQYQKELGELGIFGFTMFVLILLISGINAINRRHNTGLELCIFLFFIEAFIGASALSVDSEYSFIFWYTLGKISQKSAYYKRHKAHSQVERQRQQLYTV